VAAVPIRDRSARIVCIPSTDREFRAAAGIAVCDRGVRMRANLAGWLRRLYPAARVTRRELAHEGSAVWYVYRDGGFSQADGSWATDASPAHVVSDASPAHVVVDARGCIVDGDLAAAALIGAPFHHLLGRHLRDLLPPMWRGPSCACCERCSGTARVMTPRSSAPSESAHRRATRSSAST
jgi:hypothetical protein